MEYCGGTVTTDEAVIQPPPQTVNWVEFDDGFCIDETSYF
jgi:hypothetical protein